MNHGRSKLVSGLYLLFIAPAFLFLFVVFSGQSDLGYLFNISRHEWFRELRRDYHTSWQQFWREWRSLKRFARENRPWIFASLFGAIGLIFSVTLLIVNLPHELKASVREVYSEHVSAEQRAFVTQTGTLDTRTDALPPIAPFAEDESVLVSIPPGLRAIVQETTDPWEQQPVEPVVPEPVRSPTQPAIDLDDAFADFEPQPLPTRQPETVPEFDLTLERLAPVSAFDDPPFEVMSVAEFDIEAVYARLRGDRWSPEDKQRVPRPQHIPYEERYRDVQLSSHERERLQVPSDQIRIRPRAAGRESAPGLYVRKSVPHQANAGAELTYEIEVTNPHAEVVSRVIVEETVPPGWSIVDATPPGALVGKDTLRWDIEDLATDQSQLFKIRVLAAGDETALSRTILTTGAAVETVMTVSDDLLVPETIEPAPMISNDGGWQASEKALPATERDMTDPSDDVTDPPNTTGPPALPPSVVNRIEPRLELEVIAPKRTNPGTVKLQFVVRNTGSVAIDNAEIRIALAKELSHPRGRAIIRGVGPLEAGQSRTLSVNLQANAPGTPLSKVELRAGTTVYDRGEAVFTIEAPANRVTPASGWRAR